MKIKYILKEFPSEKETEVTRSQMDMWLLAHRKEVR